MNETKDTEAALAMAARPNDYSGDDRGVIEIPITRIDTLEGRGSGWDSAARKAREELEDESKLNYDRLVRKGRRKD